MQKDICARRSGGPWWEFARVRETNYNPKENVLSLGDCLKPLSFLFIFLHSFFFFCMLSSCDSGLKQLQAENYDGIVSCSRDVMQEYEDNNEFHREGTKRWRGGRGI